MKVLLTSDIHRGFSTKTAEAHEEFAEKVNGLEWDILVCAGDIGSSNYKHFKGGIKFLKKLAGDKPVLAVRGNHDLWDKKSHLCIKLFEQAKKDMENIGIIYLPENPYESNGVLFVGWDGWYMGVYPPYTNDPNFMPIGGHEWAKRLEFKQLTDVVDILHEKAHNYSKVVAVTHMPINPGVGGLRKRDPEFNASVSHFEVIKDKINHLMFGHTHHRIENLEIDGVKLWNAGSDYDRPRYIIIEV